MVTYVRDIQAISAVPQILETIASLTGPGFVVIAHVTATLWTTCAVRDKLDFGLQVGDGPDVTTTLCDEVRSTGNTIVIDHVQESEPYRDHHTPPDLWFPELFLGPDGSGVTAATSARCAGWIQSRCACRPRRCRPRSSCLRNWCRRSWKPSAGPPNWASNSLPCWP